MNAPGVLPLSIAIVGLDMGALGRPGLVAGVSGTDGAARAKQVIAAARGFGFAGVQLDATIAGLRPRDLDRSARRDLGATLRRHEVACSGLDFFVPAQHFAEPAHADRAVSSTIAAIELGAELASLAAGSVAARPSSRSMAVSLVLPEVLPADVRSALADACARCGTRIADFAWPVPGATGDVDAIGLGIDPATVLASGGDPAALAARLGERLVAARLTDIARGGLIARVAPGRPGGRLDLEAYRVSLVVGGYSGQVVVDLRGVPVTAGGVDVAGIVAAWDGVAEMGS